MTEGTPYKEEDIWQKFAQLPKTIQNVMFSLETGDALYAIAKKNTVADRFKRLSFCVNLIFSGVVPITSFRKLIEDELRLDQEHARMIAIEIRDKIFIQVKDELRTIHRLDS